MVEKNEIGSRIKSFRLSKGLTLKDIEVRAKVSATHVSEIERGMTSPTVGALAKIAEAMGTDVAYFVEKKNISKISIVDKLNRKKMQFQDWGATYYSLTQDVPNPKISFLEVELEPGIKRPEETSTHDGNYHRRREVYSERRRQHPLQSDSTPCHEKHRGCEMPGNLGHASAVQPINVCAACFGRYRIR
jgi:transcriptional regulator with XRE-family HTH domain